ncbi:hypothetical protein GCM10022247_62230 [Allokutzneria multivorans]|uniref:Uncharacterized protein n=1 Tax=Allokutzneria multivorans TaxID=1142134 RepID=A0ABP7TNW0_9PSEU
MLAVAHVQLVVPGRRVDETREQPAVMHPIKAVLLPVDDHEDLVGVRTQYADRGALVVRVCAEHRVGVVVCPAE